MDRKKIAIPERDTRDDTEIDSIKRGVESRIYRGSVIFAQKVIQDAKQQKDIDKVYYF